jgi:hypothetical protein
MVAEELHDFSLEVILATAATSFATNLMSCGKHMNSKLHGKI